MHHMILRCFFLAAILVFAAGAVHARSAPESFTGLADEAGPAVVNISTVKTVQGTPMDQFMGPFGGREGSPLEDFFEQFEQFFGERQMPPREARSLGSGFIISKDGLIVTNNHVIMEADEISVTLQGGATFDAEVIGRDPETDLALLQIEADRELSTLELESTEEMDIGQWVLAIGNPFGLQNTVTAGIISAMGRIIGAGPYDNFIQTDASINPGNSGGPLINMDGRVIGINTAIVATGQGIGFAIPSDQAEYVINQLQKYGKVRRGWLGVTIQDMDPNTARALDLPEPVGALVASVQPNGPAAGAGLKAGDVVLEVNGNTIQDAHDLTRVIGRVDPGETIRVTFWRNGEREQVRVELGERDAEALSQTPERFPGAPPQEEGTTTLGMSVRPLSQQEAQTLGLEPGEGLLVGSVQEGSLASLHGVQAGDVILEANGQPVNSPDSFRQVLSNARERGVVMLLLKRQGQNIFRTIPLEEEQ
ncbi:MAG: DegQ family serine endoprotease [Desulfovibrionales bacterium]